MVFCHGCTSESAVHLRFLDQMLYFCTLSSQAPPHFWASHKDAKGGIFPNRNVLGAISHINILGLPQSGIQEVCFAVPHAIFFSLTGEMICEAPQVLNESLDISLRRTCGQPDRATSIPPMMNEIHDSLIQREAFKGDEVAATDILFISHASLACFEEGWEERGIAK